MEDKDMKIKMLATISDPRGGVVWHKDDVYEVKECRTYYELPLVDKNGVKYCINKSELDKSFVKED